MSDNDYDDIDKTTSTAVLRKKLYFVSKHLHKHLYIPFKSQTQTIKSRYIMRIIYTFVKGQMREF